MQHFLLALYGISFYWSAQVRTDWTGWGGTALIQIQDMCMKLVLETSEPPWCVNSNQLQNYFELICKNVILNLSPGLLLWEFQVGFECSSMHKLNTFISMMLSEQILKAGWICEKKDIYIYTHIYMYVFSIRVLKQVEQSGKVRIWLQLTSLWQHLRQYPKSRTIYHLISWL